MSISPAQKHALTRAVEDAESVCGAEVVVVGYVRADDYLDVAFRNALAASLVTLSLLLLAPFDVHHDAVFPIVAATALLVFFISRRPEIIRLTSTTQRRAIAIDGAVAQAFLRRGVYKTRERIGMLVVWFDVEQQVRVVFDAGLEARVPGDVRARLSQALFDACTVDDRRAGAIAAIGKALEPFVPRGDDDVDELDNAPSMGGAA